MMMSFLRTSVCIVVIVANLLPSSDAYASWLKCFIDLDDPNEVIMHSYINPFEKAPHLVRIEVRTEGGNWTLEGLEFLADEPTEIQVRLAIPDALRSWNKKVQYVVEASGGGGVFTERPMCGGSRSYGTHYDDLVKLLVDGQSERIELVGAWATGHEPVSLTPRTILTRAGSSSAAADEL
jgi:hypothetical protein